VTRRNRRPAADHHELMAVLGLNQPAPRTVDARPAREHARRLRAAGWGTRGLAQRAGLARHTVQALLSGRWAGSPPTRRVLPDTAARILAIGLGEVPPCRQKPQ
jgi:lambda repressor-like predicted transcriptional regulator